MQHQYSYTYTHFYTPKYCYFTYYFFSNVHPLQNTLIVSCIYRLSGYIDTFPGTQIEHKTKSTVILLIYSFPFTFPLPPLLSFFLLLPLFLFNTAHHKLPSESSQFWQPALKYTHHSTSSTYVMYQGWHALLIENVW